MCDFDSIINFSNGQIPIAIYNDEYIPFAGSYFCLSFFDLKPINGLFWIYGSGSGFMLYYNSELISHRAYVVEWK